MKSAIFSYNQQQLKTHPHNDELNKEKVRLVLGFGNKQVLASTDIYGILRNDYPVAEIVLCSTAGEIFDETVIDGSVSITALEFEKTAVQSASVNIADFKGSSFDAGLHLVSKLGRPEELSYVLVLSDGSKVNGSELVKGINAQVQQHIPVTGGLAGDGVNFSSTLVGLNEQPGDGQIVAVGFYGNDLLVSHGSMGGWVSFGPKHTVTRSIGNQVFEMNNDFALDLYKKYLGSYAEGLPGSALLFPLSVNLSENAEPIVRTILSIDESTKSMLFAGDVPEGSTVRFMKANFDKLVHAAGEAAGQAFTNSMGRHPKLALLISCVGRKIILDTRVEEEVQAVREIFGEQTMITGFYSYGEISPFSPKSQCQLHNQTMTITTIDER